MKKIKAIIVDDESDARDVLSTLIYMSKSNVDIEIIDQCCDLPEAVISIKKHKPDVVFLDVQMPNYAGYEIVSFFDKIDFEIIFVTAYDNYALKAFELSAIDYIVKPVNRIRLDETLDRLTEKLKQNNSIEDYQILLDSIKENEFKKIIIPEIGGKRVLNINDIICIQGSGSYSTIHLKSEGEFVVSKNLKYFEKNLSGDSRFFRSQKSWIVNLDHIDSYNLSLGNIILKNETLAKLSKNRTSEFEKVFHA